MRPWGRKLLNGSERRLALELLSALRVTIDDESGHAVFHATSTLAEKYGLSADDAAYLEVALRRQLPRSASWPRRTGRGPAVDGAPASKRQ